MYCWSKSNFKKASESISRWWRTILPVYPPKEKAFILKNTCLILCLNISGFSFHFVIILMSFPLRDFSVSSTSLPWEGCLADTASSLGAELSSATGNRSCWVLPEPPMKVLQWHPLLMAPPFKRKQNKPNPWFPTGRLFPPPRNLWVFSKFFSPARVYVMRAQHGFTSPVYSCTRCLSGTCNPFCWCILSELLFLCHGKLNHFHGDDFQGTNLNLAYMASFLISKHIFESDCIQYSCFEGRRLARDPECSLVFPCSHNYLPSHQSSCHPKLLQANHYWKWWIAVSRYQQNTSTALNYDFPLMTMFQIH